MTATYNGDLWTAKWWTEGDTPGGPFSSPKFRKPEIDICLQVLREPGLTAAHVLLPSPPQRRPRPPKETGDLISPWVFERLFL